MRLRLLAYVLTIFSYAIAGHAAGPPVELELATERGVQITAPQEWLQLLARAGIEDVRIRGARAGDAPTVTNRGTADRPRYHVVGILTRREQLQLTGGTFGRGDVGRLKDYFEQLSADGAESLTAPRGRHGLTEQEMEAVFADFGQPIGFATKSQRPRAVLEKLQNAFTLKFSIDAEASAVLRSAAPVADDVQALTAGTGLAIVLRDYGLVLVPEKPRGQAVVLRIRKSDAEALGESTIGKIEETEQAFWPIGWNSEHPPRALAPSLYEPLTAEIDGYTLEETLDAIVPRLGVPLLIDHAALREHQIDPAAIKVRLPRGRSYYKRVLDRVLAQARLGEEIRIDEAGTPFVWVTQ